VIREALGVIGREANYGEGHYPRPRVLVAAVTDAAVALDALVAGYTQLRAVEEAARAYIESQHGERNERGAIVMDLSRQREPRQRLIAALAVVGVSETPAPPEAET